MSRFFVLLAAAALSLSASGCREDGEGRRAPPSRFEGVKAEEPLAGAGFCERVFPAGARRYAPPPLRSLPPGAKAAPEAGRGWTWVNVWATWCEPCLDEMALLGRWKDALAREGRPFHLELLSADAPEDAAALTRTVERGLPGRVSWLRSPDDLGAYLHSLGIARDAALPVHALVDPGGHLRCVRVGAIHERDYGAVKRLLLSP